jgi:hypothetical protein
VPLASGAVGFKAATSVYFDTERLRDRNRA